MKNYGKHFFFVGTCALLFNFTLNLFDVVNPLGIEQLDGLVIAAIGVALYLFASIAERDPELETDHLGDLVEDSEITPEPWISVAAVRIDEGRNPIVFDVPV